MASFKKTFHAATAQNTPPLAGGVAFHRHRITPSALAPVRHLWFSTFFFGWLACGCGTAPLDPISNEPQASPDHLNVASNFIWATSEIPVCWEEAGNATEKAWVRDAVSKAWEAEANIEFTGWGTCNVSTNAGIRIHVADATPAVAEGRLGNSLNNFPGGMLLNFWFNTVFANVCTGTETKREACVRHTSVHEFGHALGYAHEQNRAGAPGGTSCTAQGSNGDFPIGNQWDLSSTMYGCNQVWDNNGFPSPTDIEGSQYFYGSRRPVAVESWSSGRLDTFVRLHSSQQLKTNAWPGNWSGPAPFAGAMTGAPSVTSGEAGRLDVFVRSPDRKLYRQFWNGSAWSALSAISDGEITGNPVAVAYAFDRLAVFFRRPDNMLHVSTWVPKVSSWDDINLGGPIVGTPAAISWSDNNVDVFARGTDGTLKTASLHGGQWATLSSLGSEKFLGDPAVASWGPGRLDVFVRGTDGALWTKSWNGSNWSAYTQLGSEQFLGDPAAVSWAPNRISVFVRGTDSHLYTKTWNGAAPWSNYRELGTEQFLASPTAISWGTNRIDVFVRGTDSALYTKSSSDGSANWSNYYSIGNQFR